MRIINACIDELEEETTNCKSCGKRFKKIISFNRYLANKQTLVIILASLSLLNLIIVSVSDAATQIKDINDASLKESAANSDIYQEPDNVSTQRIKSDYINQYITITNVNLKTGYTKAHIKMIEDYCTKFHVPCTTKSYGKPLWVASGEIVNIGNRSLKSITLVFDCLNNSGEVIFTAEFWDGAPLTDSSSHKLLKTPLAPNNTFDFEGIIEQVLASEKAMEWDMKIKVRIVDIEFSE